MTEAAKTPVPAANGAPPPPAVDEAAAKKAKDQADLAAAAKREAERQRKKRLDEHERAQAEAARSKELEELRAKAKRADELEAEAKDPMGFLERRGVSARDVGERIIKKGTADERAQELQARLDKLEQEREADRKEREERLKREQGEATMRQARKAFDAAYEEVKASAPIIAKLGEKRLLEEYKKTYDLASQDPELAQYLPTYTDQDLLKATEERLRVEREGLLEEYDDEALEQALTKRKTRASSKEESEQQADATGRQGTEAASSRSAKPLTQAAVGTTAGHWKPANWDSLGKTRAETERLQNAILTDRLKKGLPCD